MPYSSVWLFYEFIHENIENLSPSAISYKLQFIWFSSLVKLTGSNIASFGFDPLEYSISLPNCICEFDPHP